MDIISATDNKNGSEKKKTWALELFRSFNFAFWALERFQILMPIHKQRTFWSFPNLLVWEGFLEAMTGTSRGKGQGHLSTRGPKAVMQLGRTPCGHWQLLGETEALRLHAVFAKNWALIQQMEELKINIRMSLLSLHEWENEWMCSTPSYSITIESERESESES